MKTKASHNLATYRCEVADIKLGPFPVATYKFNNGPPSTQFQHQVEFSEYWKTVLALENKPGHMLIFLVPFLRKVQKSPVICLNPHSKSNCQDLPFLFRWGVGIPW